MKWSFKLGTVAGTEVRIHLTFFILLAFVAFQGMGGGQGIAGAMNAVLFVSAAFLCVLLHEFGHEYESDHLSASYHRALCRLGAKMRRLGHLDRGLG